MLPVLNPVGALKIVDKKYRVSWGVENSQIFIGWINAATFVQYLLADGYSEVTVANA